MKSTRYRNLLRNLTSHPGFLFMRSLGRFRILRNLGAQLCRLSRRHAYRDFIETIDVTKSVFEGLDVDQTVASVKRDGYALGVDLPSGIVKEINQFASGATFYANRDSSKGFTTNNVDKIRHSLNEPVLLAQCFNVASQCAAIRKLEADPKLLMIAARYLDTYPTHVGTNLWWSYAIPADEAARNKAAQLFHYDLDDFAFVKFFFYLTDVDEQSGPHVCVRGSHVHKRFKHIRDHLFIRRYTDEEIARTHGAENIKTIVGKAGSGFAEDTLCIHKGEAPASRNRLLLQIQYAINNHGNQHDIRPFEALHTVPFAKQ